MFQILYLSFLILLGFLLILGFCRIIVGHRVCILLGHDWEKKETTQKELEDKKTTKITTIYQCRNCHMIQERISYVSLLDPDWEPEF